MKAVAEGPDGRLETTLVAWTLVRLSPEIALDELTGAVAAAGCPDGSTGAPDGGRVKTAILLLAWILAGLKAEMAEDGTTGVAIGGPNGRALVEVLVGSVVTPSLFVARVGTAKIITGNTVPGNDADDAPTTWPVLETTALLMAWITAGFKAEKDEDWMLEATAAGAGAGRFAVGGAKFVMVGTTGALESDILDALKAAWVELEVTTLLMVWIPAGMKAVVANDGSEVLVLGMA